MKNLYFYREEGPILLAADSLRERLADDRNLLGIVPLFLPTIKDVFRRCFPSIIIGDSEMIWSGTDAKFIVVHLQR